MEKECLWLNRGFVSRMTKGRPWLCLKLATTLDGKIADRTGCSRWITGRDARRYVHQLRNTFDCVLVGGHTAVVDDPELTVRDVAGGRNPVRVIVDPELALSPSARVCNEGAGTQTIIFCGKNADLRLKEQFSGSVTVIPVSYRKDLEPALCLEEVMFELGRRGMNTVLCEGGGRLAASLLCNRLVDEVRWFIAPKLLGDREAVQAAAGNYPVALSDALALKDMHVEPVGEDILITGTL